MASAWLQIWADVVYRKMDRSQIDRLSYFLGTRNLVLLWYAKLVSRTQLLKLVKIMSEYKNLLEVVSLVVSLDASLVRYPNWFNSMFEFCSKLIQFNIWFKIISWKFNSKDYSILNNLLWFNSIYYSIQNNSCDSIQ